MIINNDVIKDHVFSFTEIVKYVLKSDRSKGTLLSMIEYLVDCGVIERKVVDYGTKKVSVYEMNDEFGELIEGHWVTKRGKRKGDVTNGTLYFSEFGANVLANIYKSRNEYCLERMKTEMIHSIVLQTAMGFMK